MRAIIGYGNPLRGEDAFGVDVIKALESISLKETKLIECFQLTPELCLELQEFKKLIFIDACFLNSNQYNLITPLNFSNPNLSHHISPKLIVSMIDELYNKKLDYEIISMATNEFDKIKDESRYKEAIEQCIRYLI